MPGHVSTPKLRHQSSCSPRGGISNQSVQRGLINIADVPDEALAEPVPAPPAPKEPFPLLTTPLPHPSASKSLGIPPPPPAQALSTGSRLTLTPTVWVGGGSLQSTLLASVPSVLLDGAGLPPSPFVLLTGQSRGWKHTLCIQNTLISCISLA